MLTFFGTNKVLHPKIELRLDSTCETWLEGTHAQHRGPEVDSAARNCHGYPSIMSGWILLENIGHRRFWDYVPQRIHFQQAAIWSFCSLPPIWTSVRPPVGNQLLVLGSCHRNLAKVPLDGVQESGSATNSVFEPEVSWSQSVWKTFGKCSSSQNYSKLLRCCNDAIFSMLISWLFVSYPYSFLIGTVGVLP